MVLNEMILEGEIFKIWSLVVEPLAIWELVSESTIGPQSSSLNPSLTVFLISKEPSSFHKCPHNYHSSWGDIAKGSPQNLHCANRTRSPSDSNLNNFIKLACLWCFIISTWPDKYIAQYHLSGFLGEAGASRRIRKLTREIGRHCCFVSSNIRK